MLFRCRSPLPLVRSRWLVRGLFATFALGSASLSQADDWSRFRGENGAGVAASPAPTDWAPDKNIKWKVPLPGPGVSSPVVSGERVLVTCYSGYGVDRQSTGTIDDLKRHLICFDKTSGATLWEKEVPAAQPEDPFSGIGVPAHGYASHTPVTDGTRVYAFFGKGGVYAFDLKDGTELWHVEVGKGSDPWGWGSSSSPVVYDGKVYVTASAESESLVALDAATGEEVWREKAGSFAGMWGTPVLVDAQPTADGNSRTELVMSVPGEIWSFDPATGKLLWYCVAGESEQAHSSAIDVDGTVVAFGNRGAGGVAVRAGGSGDVTKTNLLWKGSQSSGFGSPISHNGKVYLISGDVVSVFDAKTGEEVGEKLRLRAAGAAEPAAPQGNEGGRGGAGGRGGRGGRGGGGGGDYASPVIAGNVMYYVKSNGDVFTIELGDTLKQLGINRMTTDSESFGGSPAISDGHLFIRSNKHLYCVGE